MKKLLFTGMMMTALLASGASLTENQKNILQKKGSWQMRAFPIGFWNYTYLRFPEHLAHQQEADVQQWSDGGFTFAMSPVFRSEKPEEIAHIKNMLNWANARNMKMILCEPRVSNPKANQTGDPRVPFQAFLNDFRNHPGVLGTFVADEPNKARAESVFAAAKMQQEMAPELLPFINLYPWFGAESEKIVGAEESGWEKYLNQVIEAGNLQVLSFDHYAQLTNDDGIREHFANLYMCRNAAGKYGIPFWVTLGCVGHWWFREPNYDDLRWQFNTAICSGASGIMWFYYYSRFPEENYRPAIVDAFWETTQHYKDLRHIQRTFHRLYGDLFNRLVSQKVMFYPDGIGEFPKFVADDLIQEITIARSSAFFHPEKFKDSIPPAVMVGEFADADGKDYVMLVNASQTQDIQIQVKFAPEITVFRPNWDQRLDKISNQLNARLAPGQEIVLHLRRK